MGIDKNLLKMTKGLLDKKAFTPPPEYQAQMMGMGPGAPMGATGMMGSMPPGMPPGGGGMPGGPGMGMDPSMMGGGMPPGMPPGAPPPGVEGQGQEIDKMDTLEKRLKNVEDQSKLILQKLDLLMDEVDHTKVGSDENKTLLWAMKQLVKES